MATFHPLMPGALSNTPARKDLEMWCGATFVLEMVSQETGIPADFLVADEFEDYSTMLETSKRNGMAYRPYFAVSSNFDRMVLNIRKKSNSWSALGPVLWTFEFAPGLDPMPGEELTEEELLTSRIEIKAAITTEMLDKLYTYELIMFTDEIFDTALRETGPFYPYKYLRVYGNIKTHQVGEL